MGLFLSAFYIVLVLILILFLINISLKDRKVSRFIEFLAIIQFLLLIVAITLNDPIFEPIGLPKGYEWIAGLLISGFVLWKSYLNPLKERVIEGEKKIERIDERTQNIQKDIKEIKEGLDNKRK